MNDEDYFKNYKTMTIKELLVSQMIYAPIFLVMVASQVGYLQLKYGENARMFMLFVCYIGLINLLFDKKKREKVYKVCQVKWLDSIISFALIIVYVILSGDIHFAIVATVAESWGLNARIKEIEE